MSFIDSVYEKLKRHPKRIVFPEGTEPRVLQAARQYVDMGLGPAVLLGNRAETEAAATRCDVPIDRLTLVDPATSSDMETFCKRLERLDRFRSLGIDNARELLLNNNYFAAMMLQNGLVDGLVGGVSEYSGALLRPLIQLVKRLPHTELISSCMIVESPNKSVGDNGVLFFADCAVVPEPTTDQLAMISVQTGMLARQLFGTVPRVAMLSFSSKRSAVTPHTEKVAAATAMARHLATEHGVEMEVDGELQVDTAILPELAELKTPGSLVAGRANVLIFPDLNSGNISYKLVQHLGGAHVFGQILLGLSRPAAELSRGTRLEDIVAVAAIVGLQAIEYRNLYPTIESENLGYQS